LLSRIILLLKFDLILVYSLALLFIQAEELRKFLWAKNVPANVYVGMRYWHPFTEEAIEQVYGGP
jgi:protoheme ferro-lyase